MARVKLGEVAREWKETCKGSKKGLRAVGLEHLEPENIALTQWDTGTDNTFSKLFYEGQVLFGRRRAYLKKAAVAPFDGICSGDITVIEANPEKLLPTLMPFLIQSNAFFDFAVEGSAGSLSPRVKWEHLNQYEFELPPLEEQAKLAEVLWAFEKTKAAYKTLLASTEDLVQAQFIEMFGEPNDPSTKWNYKKIKDITVVETGATPPKTNNKYYGGTIPWVKTGEIEKGLIYRTEENITEIALNETNCKIYPQNTVMLAMYGQGKTRGQVGLLKVRAASNQACAAILPCDDIFAEFLMQYLKIQYNHIRSLGRGAQQTNLNLSMVKNYPVIVPPISVQKHFLSFAKAADNSKFSIHQSLSTLDQARNALMGKTFR